MDAGFDEDLSVMMTHRSKYLLSGCLKDTITIGCVGAYRLSQFSSRLSIFFVVL